MQTQGLDGESSSTTAASEVSTAPSSAMSPSISVQNSYAKRMQLLMQYGLIAGITPMSQRRRLGLRFLDFASGEQVGGVVGGPREGF
jgi:hypothetical protein